MSDMSNEEPKNHCKKRLASQVNPDYGREVLLWTLITQC